jgi:hypothetical protein
MPLGPGVMVELPVLFGSGTVRGLGLLGVDVDWANATPETSTAAASNERWICMVRLSLQAMRRGIGMVVTHRLGGAGAIPANAGR